MKKIIKCICSVCIAVVLVFNSAMIPAINVHATSGGLVYGLYNIIQGLIVSGGMRAAGYDYSDVKNFGMNDVQYQTFLKRMIGSSSTAGKIWSALELAKEIDDGTLSKQLDEKKELSYDYFKITKADDGKAKLSVAADLINEAAAAVEEFVSSEDNQYLKSVATKLEDSFSTTYSNYVDLAFDSIDDIATYYSEDVINAIYELGYDDLNCMVVKRNFSYYGWTDVRAANILSGSLPSLNGMYAAFIIVPYGSSYVDSYGYSYTKNADGHSNTASVFDTATLCNYANYVSLYNKATAYSKVSNSRQSYYVVYLSLDTNDVGYFEYNGNGSCDAYFNSDDGKQIFNFKNAFENDTYYVHELNFTKDSLVQSLDTVANYITSGSGTRYANTDEYLSMEFDDTTAATLATYTDFAEYMQYTQSLSAQLSGIQDAIEDSTAQNAVQAKQIVDSINAQTNSLSSGISDVITSVKVQTDAISDVLEATKLQTDAIGDVITGINDHTLAITGPLQDILTAIQDLSITIPENLTLTIPEEKLNINVQVPDISTEVINQIEVTQDYAALQDAIAGAIAAPLTAAFVPDEDKVRVFVGDFHDKFGFVDDMKTNIDNVKTYIFGVKPSPILKIPLMKVKSKYNYGFGDYLIIDVSWYEPFRPYGDLIILAFAWLMFIWRVFLALPGIISGAPGNFWGSFSSIGTQPGIGMNDPTLIEDKRRGR